MAEYNPDYLTGRAFLLPSNQKGERHRASTKQKVTEIFDKLEEDQNTMVDNINFLLDVGQGRSQDLIPKSPKSILVWVHVMELRWEYTQITWMYPIIHPHLYSPKI